MLQLLIQRGTRKIESGNSRAAPHQAQCIPTNMALQTENALPGNVAEFGRFNRTQSVFARPKPVKHIVTSGIACMNCGALIPVPAVHFEVVGHATSM
jgi:hypothetical protein